MKKIRSLLKLPEFQVFLFALCVVLFAWPVVNLSDAARVKGMFIYLFLSWTVIIFLLYMVTTGMNASGPDRD